MIVSATGPGMPRPQVRRTGLSASPRSATSFGQDADQGVVVDAVVLALELHDLVAARVGPRDAHGVHRRLGAGDGHAGHVDPAGQLAEELHRPDLVLGGQREADAAAHPLVDVVVDAVVAVTEDDRPVAHPQVDVLVAVQVPDAAALAAVDVDRVLAPGPEVRVGAAGQRLHRPVVHRELGVAVQRGRGRGFRGHGSSVARLFGGGRRGTRVDALPGDWGSVPSCGTDEARMVPRAARRCQRSSRRIGSRCANCACFRSGSLRLGCLMSPAAPAERRPPLPYPAFGTTQPGSSRARVASASEPWPRSASWKARRSKAAPSRAASSARSRLDLAVADLVGERLAGPDDVAVRLDPGVGRREARALPQEVDCPGAVLAEGVDPRVDDEAHSPPRLALEHPEALGFVAVEAHLVGEPLRVEAPALDVGGADHPAAEPAEDRQVRMLHLQGDLEVVARDCLVVGRRGQRWRVRREGRSYVLTK